MKRILLSIFTLAAAFLASGCMATLGGLVGEQNLENSLAPTLACDKTLINSQYGPWGITSKLREADHAVIRESFCSSRGKRAEAPAVVQPAAVTSATSAAASAPK